jgi:hypothetical protein
VDGVMAATAISDINNNSEAVWLYKNRLRPWAEYGDGCHVLLLHHERKQQEGSWRARTHLSMGARQLIGQSDVHLTTKWLSREEAVLDDGTWRLRTDIELDFGKSRDDVPAPKEYVYIESIKDGRRLVSATLATTDAPPTVAQDAAKIRAAAFEADGGLRPSAAAALIEADSGDRRYKAAIEYGIAEGLFMQEPRKPIFFSGDPLSEEPAI